MIIRLMIALIVLAAKNRPGQACRPNPKCILDGLMLMKLVVGDGACSVPSCSVFSSPTSPLEIMLTGLRAVRSAGSWLHRNPSKMSGFETNAGSLLMGPDGKQMCTPLGKWRPSDNVKGSLTIRCIDTMSARLADACQTFLSTEHDKRSRTFTRWPPTLRFTQKAIQSFLSVK